jgi:pimeloyl-ACP methyl ester carboxylesterase
MVIVTGSGPEKVIFIHGFRGSITDFEYFVKRLVSSPKYECCTYYLRGVGYR